MDILHPLTECSSGAEAVLSLQPSSSISLTYHSLFGPHEDLMLLELDDKLLPEILQQRCVCVKFYNPCSIFAYQVLHIDLRFSFSSTCALFLVFTE